MEYYPNEYEILDHSLLDAKAAGMALPPDVVLRDDERDALEPRQDEAQDEARTVRVCSDSRVSIHEGAATMFSMFVMDLCFQYL